MLCDMSDFSLCSFLISINPSKHFTLSYIRVQTSIDLIVDINLGLNKQRGL